MQPTKIPSIIGTKFDLPPDVRDVAGLRSNVVAWTSLDPDLSDDVCWYACCHTCGPLLWLPCFWPHLIICSPYFIGKCMIMEGQLRRQFWILTEYELKIVHASFDLDRVCYQSGNAVQTIPLENIVDCGVQTRGKGCINLCIAVGSLPEVYVDTASAPVKGQSHEALGVALAEYEWFIQRILQQRDVVKGRDIHRQGRSLLADNDMERGGERRSIAERIQHLTELHETGVLTLDEYTRKRQEIIDSI